MTERQEIEEIGAGELKENIRRLAASGHRLVQIGCTRLDALQVDYSFDRDYRLRTLRVRVPLDAPRLPSISDIYWSAFTYENEIHDLFGIAFAGINVDYRGNFYRIALRTPFNVPPGAGKGT